MNLPTVKLPVRWMIDEYEDHYEVQSCRPDKAIELISKGMSDVNEYAQLVIEQEHETIEQLALFARFWNGKPIEECNDGSTYVDAEDAQVMRDVIIELIQKEL